MGPFVERLNRARLGRALACGLLAMFAATGGAAAPGTGVELAQAGMESWRPSAPPTRPPQPADVGATPQPLPPPAQVPSTPGEACGKRVFLAMEACIKRECEKDIYKNQRACQIRQRADAKAPEGG